MMDNTSQTKTNGYIRLDRQCIYQQLKVFLPNFQDGTQQDCNEFLLSLINVVGKPSIVSKIFQFDTYRVTRCKRCKLTSPGPIESQYILESAVPETSCTLTACLENYFKEELLEKNDMYQCEHCKTLCEANTGIKIRSAPQVLLVALKVFGQNGNSKLLYDIEYESSLNIHRWLSEECPDRTSYEKNTYKLYAIVTHISIDTTSGHYICYVKDHFTHQCYELNDELVKTVKSIFDKTSSVYLLCYTRSDPSKLIEINNEKEINAICMNTIILISC